MIDDSLKKLTKGAGIVFIGIILSKILGYVYRLIVARIGTEEYGLLSLGIAVFSLVSSISLLGLNNGVLRYVSFYKGKDDPQRLKGTITSSLKIVLPLGILISLILIIFAKQISLIFFNTESLTNILRILGLFIPITVVREIFFSVLQAFQKVDYLIYSKNLLENISKILLTLLFLSLGLNLIGLALAYSLGIALSALLAFFFLQKTFPIIRTKITSINIKKELFSYSLPVLFSVLIFSLITWIDTLMLGFFRTPSEVGIYNAALPTALLLFIIPSGVLTLFVPILTELYAKEKHREFKEFYTRITKWILMANIPLLMILYLLPKQILTLLFGTDYTSGYLALIILSTGLFIGHLFSSSAKVLLTIKKTKLILFNTITILILNIILNLFLIPKYGIVGAAIATASSFILRSILLLLESSYIIKTFPLKLNYIKILFSAFLSLIITNYLMEIIGKEVNFLYLIIFSMILILIYIILLLVTFSLEKDDKMILNAIKDKFI